MNYIKLENEKKQLINYSKVKLKTYQIMKHTNKKLFIKEITISMFSYLLIVLSVIGAWFKVKQDSEIMLMTVLFLAVITLMAYKFSEIEREKELVDVQQIRLEIIANYLIDRKIDNSELKYLSDSFAEDGLDNKRTNLRLSSTFAILLLPLWDKFITATKYNDVESFDLLIILKYLSLLLIIVTMIMLFLYIESRILRIINSRSDDYSNLSKLLKILLLEKMGV